MNYREHILASIDYIEEHLEEELNVDLLAQSSGYSKYHYLRIFKEVVGMTPADYIRKRRLTQIVIKMLHSNRFLCDIAFEYGFNSKENFNRAFYKEHHVVPSKVREVANSLKLYHRFRLDKEQFSLTPIIQKLEAIDLVVYPCNVPFPPQFWNQYNCEHRSRLLSGKEEGTLDYGISHWVEGLRYYIGIPKEEAKGDTTGTVPFQIPRGDYAVFTTPSCMQEDFVNNVQKSWDYIEHHWKPAAGIERIYGPEFETYQESSRTYQEKIYVPVKEVKIMKKELPMSWEGIHDDTGYLHSFVKSLMAVLLHSEYRKFSEDVVAATGFAFRMWMAKDLCPSATSVWSFREQPVWAKNAGLLCDYVERVWGEDEVEEERRNTARKMIKESIDRGMGAVAWDVSGAEWGVITGYNDETQNYLVHKITWETGEVPYDSLGKLEIPILSVLTVKDAFERDAAELVKDTKRLAYEHLSGQEWNENVQGIEFYKQFIQYLTTEFGDESAWNLEYYLGTYGAMKYYAWKFFEKYHEDELASCYQEIYSQWMKAFRLKKEQDHTPSKVMEEIIECMNQAWVAETKAMELMKE